MGRPVSIAFAAILRSGHAALKHCGLAGLALVSLVSSSQLSLAQQQPPTVTVAKPITREIVEDDEFVGRFEAVDDVAIRSRVAGYLDEVHFRDGAIVAKGDLLFTI